MRHVLHVFLGRPEGRSRRDRDDSGVALHAYQYSPGFSESGDAGDCGLRSRAQHRGTENTERTLSSMPGSTTPNNPENSPKRAHVVAVATVVAVSLAGFVTAAIAILIRNDPMAFRLVRIEWVIGTTSLLLLIVGSWALYNLAPIRFRHPLASLAYFLLFAPWLVFFVLSVWGLIGELTAPQQKDGSGDLLFAFGMVVVCGLNSAWLGKRSWNHFKAARRHR